MARVDSTSGEPLRDLRPHDLDWRPDTRQPGWRPRGIFPRHQKPHRAEVRALDTDRGRFDAVSSTGSIRPTRPGRLTLICRFGADQVGNHLPGLIRAVEREGPYRRVVLRSNARQYNQDDQRLQDQALRSDHGAKSSSFFAVHRAEGTLRGRHSSRNDRQERHRVHGRRSGPFPTWTSCTTAITPIATPASMPSSRSRWPSWWRNWSRSGRQEQSPALQHADAAE